MIETLKDFSRPGKVYDFLIPGGKANSEKSCQTRRDIQVDISQIGVESVPIVSITGCSWG